jgi:hypothetical protein
MITVQKGKTLIILVFLFGRILPLADKNESSATHTEDFCEKKAAKSLGFEGKLSEVTIFRQ